VYCSVLQRVAVCYSSVLQCVAIGVYVNRKDVALVGVATSCSILQCVAVCCSVMQYVVIYAYVI